MTPLIVRIKYITNEMDEAGQLQKFFKYTIQSLVNQTDPDFVCFIDYPYHKSIPFLYMKSIKFNDPRFRFLNKHALETHRYLKEQNLDSFPDLRFVELKSDQIYPSNLLARIRAANYSTKVQFLHGRYFIDTDTLKVIRLRQALIDAFIYVCPIDEYRRLFFYFDEQNHKYLRANAVYMPHITLPIPFMQYSDELMPEGEPLPKETLDPIIKSFGLNRLGEVT